MANTKTLQRRICEAWATMLTVQRRGEWYVVQASDRGDWNILMAGPFQTRFQAEDERASAAESMAQ